MIGKVRMKRVILICILILAAICLVGISKAYGATVTGTVNSDIGVNFRSEPDASKNNIIGAIPYGEKVEILGTAQGGGYSWYKISYNGKTGYAVSDFITKDTSAGHEEGDFTNTYGIVNSDIGVNVRSGPGTEYERIDGLFDGTQVKVNGETKDKNGDIWYEVVCSAGKGYIFGEYLILKEIKPYEPNADFEAHLTKQGFPESYKVLLRQLHAQYPNWIFVAGKTNLDWNYVITKEYGYAGYRPNTIQNGQPDSWKTMEDGDYNFSTGQYRSYDSGYYVAASKSLIEYYMDPRNFLNATDIFQFISSKYEPALQNSTGLQAMINGTFMSGRFPESTYSTYNAVLMDAASKSGASPYTLATMILQEQGYDGSGHSISGTEPGYAGIYNYFNIGAYASGGVSAVENGLIYARNQGWNTRAKSILGGANWFARNYVNANKYTQYLKKFNVMNGAGQVATGQYMTHVMGSYLEGRNLRSAYAGFLGTSLTFEIPVYTNMPESACPMPVSYGNNNNFLDSISVSGKTLSPAFNRFTYTYNVDAGNASKITLSAKANNSAAKVEGLGTKTLKTGTNTFNITVTATSGEKRVYTVNVKTTGSGTTDFEFTSGTIELEQGDVSGHLVKTTDKTNKLTLISSNRNVAEITKINSNDSRGYYFEITAKAVGESVITAELGGVKKSFTVKVKGKDFGFTSGTVELEQGDVSEHLVKTTDKTNKLTLTSSNKNVAEITKINSNDSRGYYFEITAKAVGESVITAELGGVKKSFTVKVTGKNFELASGVVEIGQGKVSGHLVKTTDKTNKLTLTSSNKNVAEITKINSNDSRGYYFEITAKAVGESVITAELGGVKKSFTVKVTGKDFELASGVVEIEQGKVSGHLVKTTDKTNKLTLTSSNKNVAEITKINFNDSRGYYFEITAKAVGESVITAELGGVKKSFTVKVTGKNFELASGVVEIEQGKVSGHLVKTTDKTNKLTLTSSNKNVAEITKINSNDSRGYYFEITAKAVGETVITAELGGVKKSFTVKVTGKDFELASGVVEIEQGKVSGHLVKTTDKTNKLTLTSSNRNVAEITKINSNDSRGYYFEITAKAVGETVITAELGGVKKSFTVKVN